MEDDDKLVVKVPFAGFYCSIHDEELDAALEQMFHMDRDSGDEPNQGLLRRAFDACNWSQVQREYVKAYVENFGEKFGLKLEFEQMISPREYNFTTDRVFAFITWREVKRLRREVKRESLSKVAKDWFTSYDGFISHYSSDVRDWGPLEKWDHNQLGALLQAYVLQERPNFGQIEELYLMEDDRGNGHFDQWIEEATPGIDRLYRVLEYLIKRRERLSESRT